MLRMDGEWNMIEASKSADEEDEGEGDESIDREAAETPNHYWLESRYVSEVVG